MTFDLEKTVTEETRKWLEANKRICPHCGIVHYGPFQSCTSCKSALDNGDYDRGYSGCEGRYDNV